MMLWSAQAVELLSTTRDTMQGMKARNSLFSCVLGLLLIAPALLFLNQGFVGYPLPTWLTAQDAEYLKGGVSESDVGQHMSLAGFASGALQEAIEDEVGNHIPLKAAALLGNAGVQRQAIAASNALFRWDCFPSFYGSKVLYLPKEDALMLQPMAYDGAWFDGLEGFCDKVQELAKAMPEVEFAVYMVGADTVPALNPAYKLTSRPIRYDEAVSCVEAHDGQSSNCEFLFSSYQTLESYYRDFYRSDHHWRVTGAYEAYAELAESLGLPAVEEGRLQDIGLVSGSLMRSSLVPVFEEARDYDLDHSQLTCTSLDDGMERAVDHEGYAVESGSLRSSDFYEGYFGDLGKDALLAGPGDDDVLLVSDSFGDALHRLLGLSARRLWRNDALHFQSAGRAALKEEIEREGIDKVVFVAQPDNLSTFCKRNPDFFDVS